MPAAITILFAPGLAFTLATQLTSCSVLAASHVSAFAAGAATALKPLKPASAARLTAKPPHTADLMVATLKPPLIMAPFYQAPARRAPARCDVSRARHRSLTSS